MAKMSEETKARLRNRPDPLKGRKSLINMDPVAWSQALDAVGNDEEPIPCPAPEIFMEWKGIPGYVRTRYVNKTHHAGVDYLQAYYGRLIWLADDQRRQMEAILPHFPVRVQYHVHMTGKGLTATTYNLYPAYVLVRILAFLWPAAEDFKPRLRKYLVLYDDRFVSRHKVS